MDGDEYFGTLGGSLMKDLLADLQVDDNDWSLEQLEKELATLDEQDATAPSLQQQAYPNFDAASLVVSHAQERSATSLFPSSSSGTVPPPGLGGVDIGDGTDAWSLSLQKFTALSLQEDFLAADSARKQNEKLTRPQPGLVALDGAEDYDIKEKPTIAPPPGMGGAGNAKETLLHGVLPEEPLVPDPETFPKTPQNSTSIGGVTSQDTAEMRDAILAAVMPLEGNKDASEDKQVPSSNLSSKKEVSLPQESPIVVPSSDRIPGAGPSNLPTRPMIHAPPHLPPPTGHFVPHSAQGMMQMPVPMSMPPHAPGRHMPPPPAGVIVGAAVPSRGPAWQTPNIVPSSPQPVPPPAKIFCNPFPAAPPIPATALETSYMSARDIAYVIHAILKPVLAEPVTEDDYFVQYLKRRLGGAQSNPFTPKKPRDMNSEMISRETKSKEWATEKSTLGHVSKSNVARPRALIATPQSTPSEKDNDQQKQRANLWKARVYCDQAYQAYQKVVEIWRAANPGGGVPPQVQLYLAKLMKCMGIALDNESKEYTVDSQALTLLSKLAKGRSLISRVLEQALLPPNAVQSLLPSLLNVIIPLTNMTKKSDTSSPSDDFSLDRLFRAVTGIMLKLNVSGITLVKCLEVVQSHGKLSISTPPRMECVHALLQKGGMVIGQDPSAEVKSSWENAENQFMLILQGA